MEWYPSDAALLAMQQDQATGVEYIPTGQSPYYLSFRKLIYRLLRAAERANDLRVYQDDVLSVGVRSGRYVIGGVPITFEGATGIATATDATTYLWLDNTATVQSSTVGLPSDRTAMLPLAEVTADAEAITSVTDLRGEAMLQAVSLASLGTTATAAELNQVLDGVGPMVNATALNVLCGGPLSPADGFHQHMTTTSDLAGEALFTVMNASDDPAVNAGIRFSLPGTMSATSELLVNRNNGFLQQRYNGQAYNLLGAVQVQHVHQGTLSATENDRAMGAVPVDGVVTDVILSAGGNLQSSNGADGVAAQVKVNGVLLTSVHPSVTSAEGSGFVCTDQGSGTSATVKSDGAEQVQRGDVLTVDLVRTAAGTVSVEASDVVVLVVIKADGPA